MTFARSYLDTARHVIASVEDGELSLTFDAPIYALLAHTLELQLKSCLIILGKTEPEVGEFRHDLSRLYAQGKALSDERFSIRDLEKNVGRKWIDLLRCARDRHQTSIRSYVDIESESVARELGIRDNSEIGSSLPSLSAQIQWLSERHATQGSQFRYLRSGPDHHQEIRVFGLAENVPVRTIIWSCEILDEKLRRFLLDQEKHPGHF